jgi:glycosyltransferase involved in cell wall biosynthesis
MQLLVISQYFWPENFRINELVSHLAAKGMQVSVLTGKPNYPEGKIFPGYRAFGVGRDHFGGCEIVRLPIVPRGTRSELRLTANFLSFVLSGCLLAPFALRERRVDAILVYAPSPLLQALPAILIAWLKRAPLVVWVQDLWPESLSATGYVRNRALLWIARAIVRFIYRHTDLILIPSRAFHDPIARIANSAVKIQYFPNSAENIFAVKNDDRDDSELVAAIRRKFSVVFAGNIGSAQAVGTIIRAAEMLSNQPDIHFYLVGSGSETAWVEAELKRRRMHNVTMPGRLEVTAMPAVLSAASVLLVSLKDEPIFGYTIPGKLQSYLAVGRPIIASMNGEGARIVHEAKAGFACPAENAPALADAILALFAMTSDQLSKMGENGRQYFFSNFNQGRLVDELVQHLDAAILAHGVGG